MTALGNVLGLLGTNMPQEHRQPLIAVIINRMTNSPSQSPIWESNSQHAALAGALTPFAMDLPQPRETAANFIVSRMTDTTAHLSIFQIASLGHALAPLAADLPQLRETASTAIVSRIADQNKKLSGSEIATLWKALERWQQLFHGSAKPRPLPSSAASTTRWRN
jgi:hypothetical protein